MTNIADLFEDAGKRLRSEFESIRLTNPHSGEKGEEIESIVKAFLNAHLPRRFAAGSGILLDFDGGISRQTDVIVYDALTSPVYRSAEKTQILPAHTAAAVIEVKTSLDSGTLRDGYEKIASCKALRRPAPSNMDRSSTPGGLDVTGTMGVIFGFSSKLKLETVADHVASLNGEFDSDLWPDAIVLLDNGVISYGVQWPGDEQIAASLGTRPARGQSLVYPPPWYVHMVVHQDGPLTLNRFFMLLLMQTAFFPYRHQMPPYKAFLRSDTTEALTIQGYRFTAEEKLEPASTEQIHGGLASKVRWEIRVHAADGQQLAQLQYLDWTGGGVVRGAGLPLQGLLPLCIADPRAQVLEQRQGVQITNILPIDADTFKSWLNVINARTNMKATLHDLQQEQE